MSAVSDRYAWMVGRVLEGSFDKAAITEGFAPLFLTRVPAPDILTVVKRMTAVFNSPELSRQDTGTRLTISYDGVEISAVVENDAPHRFTGLLFAPRNHALDDRRVKKAQWSVDGTPGEAVTTLKQAFTIEGLVGVVAGEYGDNGATPRWRIAGGFADLKARRPVALDTPMFAGSIAKLLTAVAVLQLVGDGRVDLDAPANRYLRGMHLSSDAATIRHLLTHTAGVPSEFDHYATRVPPATRLLGEEVTLDFEPGERREYSNGGYTVLGEVIAGVTDRSAIESITQTVLIPLEIRDSSYPLTWPDDVGPGYRNVKGKATEMNKTVPTIPTAGGLVTTIDDLARFVAGWRGLLRPDLAEAAVTNQVLRPEGGGQGFGWLVAGDEVGHAGGTRTYSSSLLWRMRDGVVNVMMTNVDTNAEAINLRLRGAS